MAAEAPKLKALESAKFSKWLELTFHRGIWI